MITHSTSKRHVRKAVTPQVESTILIEYTDAPILKRQARQSFTINNALVKPGETFYLINSARRQNRYYVVHFSEAHKTYRCLCGCASVEHEHLKVVRDFVMNTVVKPSNPDAPEMSVPATMKEVKARRASRTPSTNYAEIAKERPLTPAEWRAIAKADKARQAACASEYRQAAEALRKETA